MLPEVDGSLHCDVLKMLKVLYVFILLITDVLTPALKLLSVPSLCLFGLFLTNFNHLLRSLAYINRHKIYQIYGFAFLLHRVIITCIVQHESKRDEHAMQSIVYNLDGFSYLLR